jgi:hypothetical protein
MKEPDPEKVAALAQRAQRLSKLKDHESWGELRALFEERQRKHFDNLTRQLLAGAEVDQRYVDRMAGFFRGAQWLLDNPEMAETSLRTALRRAELFQELQKEIAA